MAKLGFSLPNDLEQRLIPYMPWGTKQRVIEGLLRVLVKELEAGDFTLWKRVMKEYHETHNPRRS